MQLQDLYQPRVLKESAQSKLKHLDHIEDLVFLRGMQGANDAIKIFNDIIETLSNKTTKTVISRKWDGAPSIVFGMHPTTKKFFVGTKSVFASTPKVISTVRDLDHFYPDKEGLHSKLYACLRYLPELGLKGVYQGDLMFTADSKDVQDINGEKCITFKPNTLLYAVQGDSILGARIAKAKLGIVVHTMYTGGPLLSSMDAQIGFDASSINFTNDVWVGNAIQDIQKLEPGQLSLLKKSIANISKFISSTKIKDLITGNKKIVQSIMKFINSMVRESKTVQPQNFAAAFGDWYSRRELTKPGDTLSELEYIKANAVDLSNLATLFIMISTTKLQFIDAMASDSPIKTYAAVDGKTEPTKDEGFVISEKNGQTVKMVDRQTFSRMNFAKNMGGFNGT